jgi:sulfonate transport system substrate-binding protein
LWATSPEQEEFLTKTYADYSLKERTSPLMDDSFLARSRRNGEDAKRFGLISAADPNIEGRLQPKYLRHALAELNLKGFWTERDGEGKPKREL